MVKTGGFLNLLHWYIDEFKIGERDNILLIAPVSFDLAQKNLFSPHMVGGCLTLAAPGIPDYRELSEVIQNRQVTLINCAPSVFYPLIEFNSDTGFTKLKSLRAVILGGEPIRVDKLVPWVNSESYDCEIINTYGPTECTDIATFHRIPRESFEQQGMLPIGSPIPGVKVYILNKLLAVIPTGIPGELCIGGIGLSRGYLNRPELTAEKFNRSYSPYSTHIFYKTGDLSRWLEDGNIEFLGRIDQQVKVRGNRVELEEIEIELLKHKDIVDAVVTAKKTGDGNDYLCGYIVSGRELPVNELREYLAHRLPDYMIPSFFVFLDKIPLTPSGKVDRRALPEPEAIGMGMYAAPRDAIEGKLVTIWSEVLEREASIGIDDNFFHLGGHSLKVTILVSKIYNVFNVKVLVTDIFKTPTIREISKKIMSGSLKTNFIDLEPTEEREYYELSFNQKRLWLLNRMQPESASFSMPGSIELTHHVDEDMIKRAIYKIVERHEGFRTGFRIVNDEPVQYVVKYLEIPFKKIDISVMEESEKQEKRAQVYIQEQKIPFDLSVIPLFRFLLLKLDETHYEFIFNMHHIVTDGWSNEMLGKEFLFYYEGLKGGTGYNPGRLKLQYKDFAAWHNKQIRNPEIKQESHRFWKERLGGNPLTLHLPVNPHGDRNDLQGAGYLYMLDKDTKNKLEKIAQKNKTTLFTVMFSIYLIWLSRLSNREEVICSIISAGREDSSLQEIAGFFVNSILFNITIHKEERFVDFLQRVSRDLVEVFQHQWYPLELVFKELKMKYPDAPVSFNMLNIQERTANREFENFQPVHNEDVQDVKFDIEVYITEYKNGILLSWAYKKSLFKPSDIEYIVEEYGKLIDFFKDNFDATYMKYKEKTKKRSFKRNN